MLIKQRLENITFNRFSAVQPHEDDAHLKRGLSTRGQLGLWLSLARLFQMVGSEGGDGYVLVTEDDSVMSPGLPSVLDKLPSRLVSRKSIPDIVFLSYFITSDLISTLASAGLTLPSQTHYLLPSSRFYLACTDCFLLSRSAAAYLGQLLQRALDSGVKLAPVDIAIRDFIRKGIIASSLVFPPAAATTLGTCSTINENVDSALRSSQVAHSVLRAVVSSTILPGEGISLLTQLFGVSPNTTGRTVQDFLQFYDSFSSKMVAW